MKTVIEFLPYIAGAYELLSRAIPTKKNWSIVHGVLKALVWVSNATNRQNPYLPNLPKLLIVALATMFLLSCASIRRADFDCLSRKDVHVTLIDKHGNPYTFHSTYCDSIRVDILPDSTKVKQ